MNLYIDNNNKRYYPSVLEGIKWTTERKGSPGILNFTVYSDEALVFEEGNSVGFMYDDDKVFYGYVFTKRRTKERAIEVTAYDQLRYLKNKDTYVYENKKASEVIKKIASDFKLNTGNIDDTEYVIPSRLEDNKTLFDIINKALEITLDMKGEIYTLYDDFGKLSLKRMENMATDLLICEISGEDYNYTSSIDSNTYNKIKITYDNESTGKREVFIAQDSTNINKWGALQYYEAINTDSKKSIESIRATAKLMTDMMLTTYNQVSKSLTFRNLLGDTRARAGSSVWVSINLGDVYLNNYMLINKAIHTFSFGNHTMDLELVGGNIFGE